MKATTIILIASALALGGCVAPYAEPTKPITEAPAPPPQPVSRKLVVRTKPEKTHVLIYRERNVRGDRNVLAEADAETGVVELTFPKGFPGELTWIEVSAAAHQRTVRFVPFEASDLSIELSDSDEIVRAREVAAAAARQKEMTKRIGDFELYWDYDREGSSSAFQTISGTLKNLGDAPVSRVPVRVDVWDDTGKEVVHSDWTFAVDALPLRQGESRRWSIMIKKPAPRVSVTLLPPR